MTTPSRPTTPTVTTPLLTTYFKTKKRRLSPTSTDLEPPKKIQNKVSFVQKGMLSPEKKRPRSDDAVTKETPDLKKLLSKAGKLEELRGVLGRWREAERRRESGRKKESGVQEEPPLEIASEEKSPVKEIKEKPSDIFTSPVKLKDIQEEKKPPAFRKFRHLLDKQPVLLPKSSPPSLPPTPNLLPLPHPSTLLLTLFTSMETITSILTNRSELATFPKIRHGVASLTRSVALRESHLAQFLTVLPNCYLVTREGKELVVKFPHGHKHGLHGRKTEFEGALRGIVLREHEKFLLTLTPPLVLPPDTVITRYHPKFPLEKLPPILPSPLPEIPKETVVSAKELILRAKGLVCAESRDQQRDVAQPAKVNPTQKVDLNKLKGVSRALIEKIRARETQTLAATLTTPPATLHRASLLEKLPRLVPILRNMFNLEKKCSLLFDVVVERCVHSYGNGALRSEIIQQINLLAAVAPKFLQIIKLDVTWVKVDLGLNLGEVVGGIKLGV